MRRARLIKTGVAEVVYLQKEHPQEAIQKYHNRELDGLYILFRCLIALRRAHENVIDAR